MTENQLERGVFLWAEIRLERTLWLVAEARLERVMLLGAEIRLERGIWLRAELRNSRKAPGSGHKSGSIEKCKTALGEEGIRFEGKIRLF